MGICKAKPSFEEEYLNGPDGDEPSLNEYEKQQDVLQKEMRVMVAGIDECGKTDTILQLITLNDDILTLQNKKRESFSEWKECKYRFKSFNVKQFYPSNLSTHSADSMKHISQIFNNGIDYKELLIHGFILENRSSSNMFFIPSDIVELIESYYRIYIESYKFAESGRGYYTWIYELFELPYIHKNSWFQYYDLCMALIFIIDLSCYDEYYYYDDVGSNKRKNKMSLQLQLFADIVNNKNFDNNKMLIKLVFTKQDIFKQKIITVPLDKCPEFIHSPDPAFYVHLNISALADVYMDFIREQFLRIVPAINENISNHHRSPTVEISENDYSRNLYKYRRFAQSVLAEIRSKQ